jgi:hypothetical protein
MRKLVLEGMRCAQLCTKAADFTSTLMPSGVVRSKGAHSSLAPSGFASNACPHGRVKERRALAECIFAKWNT